MKGLRFLKRPGVSAVVLVALAVGFTVGCRRQETPQNFILITLDTLRADHVSAYSPKNSLTPNLDILARQGILFKNAFSLIPITLPSHASMFFSEPPSLIKNYNNGQIIRNKRNIPSFVNLFKKSGFLTAAFVSLGVLKSQFGLTQGFDTYVDDFPERRWYLAAEEVNARVFPWLESHKDQRFFLWVHYSDPHDPYAPPDTPDDLKVYCNEKLVGQYCLSKYVACDVEIDLEPGRNEVRLEVINKYLTNPDIYQARLDRLEFDPPANAIDLLIDQYRGWEIRREDHVFFFKKNGYIEIINRAGRRRLKITFRGKLNIPDADVRALYQKEVEYMDREIGKLWDKLRALGLFSKTAILAVGDHGEGLFEFKAKAGFPHVGHIHFLYKLYLQVPLLLYSPSLQEPGVERDEFVSLLDVGPTITRLMGFKPLSHFRGRDLLRLKKGQPLEIFEETYRPEALEGDKFGLLHYPWHLILTPQDGRYEFFDWSQDPRERQDLYGQSVGLPAEVQELKQRLDAFARDVLKGKEEIKIDKKTEEMLRTLGYVR